ncbi:tol-pal system YbgF family protein [Gracilinema caldarium]|uniref:tetratricopeptide repeat protein n=1 Tax=Gracilinema caldarium TaxID=215591 RepID=UPI0026F02BCE|nr:hypothetical protein [Gracilinema caldarium]
MKHPEKVFLLILIALSKLYPILAEDTTSALPFVRQLTAAVQDNVVRLQWIDAPDSTGPVTIIRKIIPAGSSTPKDLDSIQVPHGVQSYIEPIESDGLRSYLVLASGSDGNPYMVRIPNTNYVELDVKKTNLVLSQSDSKYQNISSLKTEVQKDSILLSFSLNGSETTSSRPLVLYRSTQPIRHIQDLLQAVIVQGGITSSPFVDYPVPDISYYYALVFEDDIKQGKLNLEAGKNTTLVPAEVPAGSFRIGLPGPQQNIRSIPLPTLSISAAVPSADNTIILPPLALPLSPETQKAVASLPFPEPQKMVLKKPRAFSQDLNASGGGEEFTLRSIVQGPFASRDWNEVIDQLVRFLSLPRSSIIEARGRFYLGQAYYMTEKYREALFEFLLMQNTYPAEAREWIQSILPLLQSKGM